MTRTLKYAGRGRGNEQKKNLQSQNVDSKINCEARDVKTGSHYN